MEHGLLACRVVPVAMVGLYADRDVAASDLCSYGKQEEKGETLIPQLSA